MKLLLMIMVLTVILCMIFSLISDKYEYKMQKLLEFECGFNSIVLSRLSFSLQYFMISILFLVFDLEIIIIMPLIEDKKMFFLLINLILMMMLILILGLYIEWFFGLVDWSK